MFTLIISISLAVLVEAYRYEFVFDDSEIFANCPHIPDNNGIHDLVDMSKITYELMEDGIKVFGNTTFVWEGVKPSDRIQMRGEVFKFQQGTWHVTSLSMTVQDFCKVQFDPNALWYQMWGKHVPLDERECVNVNGHTYHFEPFTIDTFVEYP
ncbi:uncharacterized protein [Musca autumnalis]|uniref:uncharacterized protein n=1 Tax=Musca autumnalis TaxID=221902 RepID=UPI003CE9461C